MNIECSISSLIIGIAVVIIGLCILCSIIKDWKIYSIGDLPEPLTLLTMGILLIYFGVSSIHQLN